MPPLLEYQIQNDAVDLHVLSSRVPEKARVAVAVVPGLSETADDWRGLIEYLSPLPSAAVSLRGRGKSSTPSSGYSLADHASDVAAFVSQIPAVAIVLVAFSRSVGYALEYAAARPPRLARLVLLDYPPRHTSLRPGWADSFAESDWRGRKAGSILSSHALQLIERDAAAKDFTACLFSIRVPTLVIRAGQTGGALSVADAAVYKDALPRCTLLTLEQSSHALWEPESSPLYEAIAVFAREAASDA